jgi:hypothetical protein
MALIMQIASGDLKTKLRVPRHRVAALMMIESGDTIELINLSAGDLTTDEWELVENTNVLRSPP